MNFLLIDQTLRNVLNVISGVPANTAQGAGQPILFPQVGTGPITDGRGNRIALGSNGQAKITYDYISIAGWGYDEWRTRYDATIQIPGDTYEPDPAHPDLRLGGVITTNTGVRALTVQIKVECFDSSDGKAAWPILEKVRTRMGLPTVIDALAEAGIAIQTIGASHPAEYDDANGRRVSVAFFEIVFNGSDAEDDDPATTIESATVPYQPPHFTTST